MSETLEIWVCSGPRCQAAGGDEARALARRVGVDCGVRTFERNCFSRCELSEKPLPAVRVARNWVLPATAESLKAAIQLHRERELS